MKRLFFLFPLALFANTLNLNNDSNAGLTVKIISSPSSNGVNLDTLSLDAGSQIQWEDLYGGAIQGQATSPYTLIWTCASGAYYGTSYGVPAGATVSAQGSDGPRQCQTISPNYNP